MSVNTTERQFAYGEWVRDGVACPIEAAGRRGDRDVEALAEEYDERVRTLINDGTHGIVEESIARDAWLYLIDEYEMLIETADDADQRFYYRKRLQAAEIVRDSLGWA